MAESKWVKLSEFSSAAGIPRKRVYRLIKEGKLSKRVEDGEAEVLLQGEDLEIYEKSRSEGGEYVVQKLSELADISDPEGDAPVEDAALKLMQRSLRTFVLIHKEVSSEKQARIQDLNKTLESKDYTIDELKEAFDDANLTLKERDREIEGLKESLSLKEATLKEKEKLLREARRMSEHKDEILAERKRALDELTKALEEMEMVADEKSAMIEELRSSPIVPTSYAGSSSSPEYGELKEKLLRREQELKEARALVDTLESMMRREGSLKSALKETAEESTQNTVEMIQDQLTYLMASDEPESSPPDDN